MRSIMNVVIHNCYVPLYSYIYCHGEHVQLPQGIISFVPECIRREDATGLNYWGTMNTTSSGRTCQMWKDEHPHEHHYTHLQGEYNYCRNRCVQVYTYVDTHYPNHTDTHTYWSASSEKH